MQIDIDKLCERVNTKLCFDSFFSVFTAGRSRGVHEVTNANN